MPCRLSERAFDRGLTVRIADIVARPPMARGGFQLWQKNAYVRSYYKYGLPPEEGFGRCSTG